MRYYRVWGPLVIVAVLLTTTQSCDPYSHLAKSRLISERDSAALHYYRKGKYNNAGILLEELLEAYRSIPRAEYISYIYATMKMKQREYITAGHYFQIIVDQYPNGKYAEESLYNVGYCHYLQSNQSEYDQTETKKAIEGFQLFASVYPDVDRIKEVNEQVKEMRDRLAKKAYDNTLLYFNLGHYKAAGIALKDLISDYPDSRFREEAQFKLLQSQYLYAQQSIDLKKEERLLEAMATYLKFAERFPQSRYIRQAEDLYTQAESSLKKMKGPKA